MLVLSMLASMVRFTLFQHIDGFCVFSHSKLKSNSGFNSAIYLKDSIMAAASHGENWTSIAEAGSSPAASFFLQL